MITLHPASERGHTNLGWLDSYHSFSFGDYHDPDHSGFRALRVINQDRVEPKEGFGTHPHRDMEIITYVLEGELRHQDSLGTSSTIRPGEVQRMTAGTGVLHSETNPSDSKPVRLLQIWVFPDKKGLKPGYEQKEFPENEKKLNWRLILSPQGEEGSLTIHQDARVYSSLLSPGQALSYENREGRYAWIQVAKGKALLNGKKIEAGDGVAVTGAQALRLESETDSEFLLFDLP